MIVPLLVTFLAAATMLLFGINAMGVVGEGEMLDDVCFTFQPTDREVCRESMAWITGMYNVLGILMFVIPGITLIAAIWMWHK